MSSFGAMFQWTIDQIFKEYNKVLGIANNILVVGFEVGGSEHASTLHQI